MERLQESELETIYRNIIERLSITYRQPQFDFIKNMYASFFEAPVVSFNESPTGTGKSFGYLIPSFIHLQNNPDQKVIISTKTLNLQEQLVKKDIPTIQGSFHTDKVKIAVLKGRSNYFCGYRCFKENTKYFSSEVTERIRNWAENSNAEKEEFVSLGLTYRDWQRVETKDSRECPKKSCEYYKTNFCGYYQAHDRAKNANIIVVNHYLLFTDIWQRFQGVTEVLIPMSPFSNIVLDEAHLLEDIITSTFTYDISREAIYDLVYSIKTKYTIGDDTVEHDMLDAATKLSSYVKTLETDALPPSSRLTELLTKLTEGITKYINFVVKVIDGGDDLFPYEAKIKIRATLSQLKDVQYCISLVVDRSDKKFVVWREEETIHITLIDYKNVLERSLYNDTLSLNLVSATLSFQQQFYFPLRSLFIDKLVPTPKLNGKIYPPIFDKNKVMYITPKNLVDYRDEKYDSQLIYITKKLVEDNNGSALLLFTSLKRMNKVYESLKKEKYDFPIYVQSSKSSKTELLSKFKEEVSSVLLGSYSFWEGVDVPGDSLTLIIIDKLPFDIPSEVSNALSNQFGGFMYQCFKTTLKLKQGIGRLIRTDTDHGKIIICDNRLHNTSWGKQIYKNLQ